MKVLVTGATGLIGHAFIERELQQHRFALRAAVRGDASRLPRDVERVVIGDIGTATDWEAALSGVDAVLHLAARVHVMRDTAADPLTEFRRVNVDGTLALARAAASSGVRRFVFLSSVKVNGESGVFRETDAPAPRDPYGVSKMEAEAALRAPGAEGGMEVVIVRSPLVYGRGARANFRALVNAVARGVPLPFGAIDNRRSLVGIDNLTDFLATAIQHPAAANQTFFVSDGEDLSTPDLIRRIGRALNRPARLLSVPPSVLQAAASLIGRRDMAQRLLGSLQVDITKARITLGWRPPVSVDEGLTRAVS